jgi:hypothetical protein
MKATMGRCSFLAGVVAGAASVLACGSQSSPGGGATSVAGGGAGDQQSDGAGTESTSGGATTTGGRGPIGVGGAADGRSEAGGASEAGAPSEAGGSPSVAGSGGVAGQAGLGGASAQLLLFEDFESGDAARWTLSPVVPWTIVTDETQVYQQLKTSDAGHWLTASAGDPTWTDVTVEARVKMLSFTSEPPTPQPIGAGVCLRFQDDGNFYFAELLSDQTMALRRRKGTTKSSNSVDLTAPVPVAIFPNTWFTIKLQARGSTLTAYLDGVLALTATDTNLASGAIGIGTFRAAAAFDDVRVTKP